MPEALRARAVLLAGSEHQVDLVQGRGGVFDIRRDGALVYSKKKTGRYPTDSELNALLISP